MAPQTRQIALTFVAALLFHTAPVFAQGQIHIVEVGDSFFSPSELTIQVGDTVRWVNDAGGLQHDVESDTGVFSSGATAAQFTFEFTFTEPGVYPYYCSLHGGPGGVGMSGVITVEDTGDAPLVINPGLNDAWADPTTPGQGLLFTVFPDLEVMFAAWFTYDSERPDPSVTANLGEPGHRWVTAIGGWEDNVVTLDVELTTGGVFDEGSPEPSQSGGYGTLEIEFHDCSTATMTYEFPGPSLAGTVELQRITGSNVGLCEMFQDDGT